MLLAPRARRRTCTALHLCQRQQGEVDRWGQSTRKGRVPTAAEYRASLTPSSAGLTPVGARSDYGGGYQEATGFSGCSGTTLAGPRPPERRDSWLQYSKSLPRTRQPARQRWGNERTGSVLHDDAAVCGREKKLRHRARATSRRETGAWRLPTSSRAHSFSDGAHLLERDNVRVLQASVVDNLAPDFARHLPVAEDRSVIVFSICSHAGASARTCSRRMYLMATSSFVWRFLSRKAVP